LSKGIIQKKALFVTPEMYQYLDKRPVSKEFGNQWFEDYPIKWYEFYFLRRLLNQVIEYSGL
jgi:hypothetical protein